MLFFSGNHECVSIINNFVPLEDVFYFTRKQPFEEEPKLKAQLAKPIHKLVMSVRHVLSYVNGSDDKQIRNAILKDPLQFTQMLSFEQSNYFLCIANFLCFDYSNFVHESFDLQEIKKTLENKSCN